MPDLIQVADQLKSMPDNWLASQMQSPSGEVPPWLVASEVARRQKLRSGSAQAQAPQSSVSQDLIRSLYAKIPPMTGLGPPTPPGMPPVNLTPGGAGGTLGTASPGAPPANMRMPAKMAEGGEVTDDAPETGGATPVSSIDDLVQNASENYLIAPEVIRSLIASESSGKSAALSTKGARGLMQIMPGTAAQLGVTDPAKLNDPAINIDTGTRYLRQLIDKYQDLPTALAAYNAGPGAVDKHGGQIPPYPETVQYVSKTIAAANAMRAKINLPPLAQVPDNMRSRLLSPPAPLPQPMGPPQANTGARAAQAAAQTLNQADYGPQATAGPAPADTTRQEILGASGQAQLPSTLQSRLLQPQGAAPISSAPVPSAPVETPEENAVDPEAAAIASEVIGAPPAATAQPAAPATAAPATRAQAELQAVADAKQTLADFQKSHQPLDQRLQSVYKAENLKTLNDAAQALFGKPQDYSKYQRAIDNVMAMAQERMHPSIGDGLIAFGTAISASREHNFLQAAGQAGAQGSALLRGLQQQGMKDYLEAARAGIALQEKADAYTEKLGQYKMQRLGAQQSGIMQDERSWQSHLAGLEKGVVTAQLAYNKALEKAPAKAPPVQDQLMASAIATTAQKYSIPLPTDHVPAVTDLPIQYQQEAKDMYANDAAQRTVAAQQKVAAAATKDLDPEYIGQAIAQTGHLPPGFGRSPLTVAKMWNIGTDWLKKSGYTPQAAQAEQSAIKANQAALIPLTKLYTNVEAFSKTTELNMAVLEKAMAQVQDYGAPVFNTPARELAKQWKGDPRISAFEASLKSVQSEVGKILSSATASGAITQSEREDIERKLGPGATAAQIRATLGIWRQEMSNRRNAYAEQVQGLTQHTVFGRTGANPNIPPPGGAPPPAAGASQYRNLHKNGSVTIGIGADGKWHDVSTGAIVQ